VSSSSSVFALPERLAAKSDQRLIGADAEHFATVVSTIRASLSDLAERLAATRSRSVRPGWEAVDRDLEARRLSKEITMLERLRSDLCLGRFVRADAADSVYIGRFGLADNDGRRLLIDWRVPAAAPYFAATRAQPMGVSTRRRYRWSGGRIVDYWDEVLTDDADLATISLDDESAFIASLGSSRSSQMRDVLGTIQADQDAIIRASSRGALVVDGGPGTGKTVVALHRTAYLLYADPAVSEGRGGVLFIGPHGPYLSYVSDVLPSLGEEGVQICTLRDLVVEGAGAGTEKDQRVAALKESGRLLDAVEAAVGYYERPPTRELLIQSPWCDIRLTAAEWDEAFGAADPAVPHNDARDDVWNALLDVLMDAPDAEDAPRTQLLRALARDEDLTRAFSRAWPVLDPANVVADLWSSPAYLRLCAPWLTDDEVQALQRSAPHAWTASDLPFLDAARRRIGDPEASRRARERERMLAADREQMERVVDDLIAADDDGEGLVTMLRGEDARESLIDDSGVPVAAPDRLVGPFAHIVVDEAQELTDAEWRMLLSRCPSRSFTIVGDRAQARRGFTESWVERLERVGFRDIRTAPLTVNYRTPEEIMSAAEPIIRAVLPDANVPTSIRSSGMPVRLGNASELIAILETWLAEHAEGIACVIGASVASHACERVRWLTPALAKGLEFDLVILVDPQDFGSGITGAVDRYVAMTRATQQLVILSNEGD
jgi:DNA helicase IV